MKTWNGQLARYIRANRVAIEAGCRAIIAAGAQSAAGSELRRFEAKLDAMKAADARRELRRQYAYWKRHPEAKYFEILLARSLPAKLPQKKAR